MKRKAQRGLEECRRTFAQAGLTPPPIPSRFEKDLRVIGPWCFSTRPIVAMEMYFFDGYVKEALTKRPAAYVAVSHAGHGANSYAINYHLIDGPLALFAQVGWGGIYSDPAESSARVNNLFDRIADVISAIEAAKS